MSEVVVTTFIFSAEAKPTHRASTVTSKVIRFIIPPYLTIVSVNGFATPYRLSSSTVRKGRE